MGACRNALINAGLKNLRLARPLFGRFNSVLAQSQVDANRFIALGAETVINSGNLKIDAPSLKYNEDDFQQLKTALGQPASPGGG